MAAPVVSGGGSVAAATGTTVGPTLPAGIAADDIIVIWAISSCALADTETTVFTWPSGYTEGASVPIKDATGGVVGRAGWAWKRATGADSGVVTVTRNGTTGTSTSFLSNCCFLTGCETSGDPFETKVSNNPNYTTTIDWPSITTTIDECTLIILFLNGDNVNLGSPSGWSPVVSNSASQGKDCSADCDKRLNVAPGTYDPPNGTATSDAGWATFQIAFKPPGVGGGPSPGLRTMAMTGVGL